jgi:hypothetical protein
MWEMVGWVFGVLICGRVDLDDWLVGWLFGLLFGFVGMLV